VAHFPSILSPVLTHFDWLHNTFLINPLGEKNGLTSWLPIFTPTVHYHSMLLKPLFRHTGIISSRVPCATRTARCISSISQSNRQFHNDIDIGARYDALRLGSDGSLTSVSISKSEILSRCQIHMRDLLQLGK
jgi:hypothetical protein